VGGSGNQGVHYGWVAVLEGRGGYGHGVTSLDFPRNVFHGYCPWDGLHGFPF
jgi:hypothetical protein